METQNRFEVLAPLGKGSFGVVSKVVSTNSRKVYTAKISSEDGKNLLIAESNIHSRLTHPNIVQFVTSFDISHYPQNPLIPVAQGDYGVILLEFCKEGTLSNILQKYGRLKPGQLKLLVKSMISVLIYLKEQGIIHRDIKPDNILFCNNYTKLSNFGVAKFAHIGQDVVAVGTPLFMAFESWVGEYTFATDIYALGVTLYYAYVGQFPFVPPTLQNLTQNYTSRSVDFRGKIAENLRIRELEDLISKMLKLRPGDRITPKMILRHPFLMSVSDAQMDDFDDDELSELEMFRRVKLDFGDGNREQFYYYFANLDPSRAMMSLTKFIELWDQL